MDVSEQLKLQQWASDMVDFQEHIARYFRTVVSAC